MLVRLRITKIDERAVAHVFGNIAVMSAYDILDLRAIGPEDFLQILWIKAGRESCRPHEVAKHHRELSAFSVMRHLVARAVCRCPCCELFDGIEDFSAMADSQDSDFL